MDLEISNRMKASCIVVQTDCINFPVCITNNPKLVVLNQHPLLSQNSRLEVCVDSTGFSENGPDQDAGRSWLLSGESRQESTSKFVQLLTESRSMQLWV